MLSSCSSISINEQGIREFVAYQTCKEIEDIGRTELKREWLDDPSFTADRYQERRNEITSPIRNFPKGEMLRVGNLFIDNKGHLKIKIEGKKDKNSNDYGLFRTKRDSPIQIFTGISPNSFRIGMEIEDLRLWIKTNTNGEFEFMVLYSIKF